MKEVLKVLADRLNYRDKGVKVSKPGELGEMLHQPKEEYRKKMLILSRENLIHSWEGRIRDEHVNPIGNLK